MNFNRIWEIGDWESDGSSLWSETNLEVITSLHWNAVYILLAYIGIESDNASTCVIDRHAREIVAKLIGDSWRELARNLPWHIKPIFVDAKIQNIHAEFPNSQYEAAHKVFSEWHGDQGDGATLEKLRYTLIKIGKQHIAKELVK